MASETTDKQYPFKGDFINNKDYVLVERILIKGWGLLAGVVLN